LAGQRRHGVAIAGTRPGAAGGGRRRAAGETGRVDVGQVGQQLVEPGRPAAVFQTRAYPVSNGTIRYTVGGVAQWRAEFDA